jgi:hypothetical protein
MEVEEAHDPNAAPPIENEQIVIFSEETSALPASASAST